MQRSRKIKPPLEERSVKEFVDRFENHCTSVSDDPVRKIELDMICDSLHSYLFSLPIFSPTSVDYRDNYASCRPVPLLWWGSMFIAMLDLWTQQVFILFCFVPWLWQSRYVRTHLIGPVTALRLTMIPNSMPGLGDLKTTETRPLFSELTIFPSNRSRSRL